MANFVSLDRQIPDPDRDSISQVVIGTSPSTAVVGLWGFYDPPTGQEMTVQIVRGPGRVIKGRLHGTRVVGYTLQNISEATVVQGFLGDRPWTTELPVVKQAIADKKRNELLLKSTDPTVQEANVYTCGGSGSFPTRIVPVPIDGHHSTPPYRGLAIHVTAGENNAESVVKNTWGSTGVAAHFIIERSGAIVQTVALTLRAEAQGGPHTVGDPNSNWLSVELVTAMNNAGTNGWFTANQIHAANRLFLDLADKYDFPTTIASPLVNDQADYAAISRSIAERFRLFPANSFAEAQSSRGLSCHRWLNAGHACPGLIGLRTMPAFAGFASVDTDIEF